MEKCFMCKSNIDLKLDRYAKNEKGYICKDCLDDFDNIECEICGFLIEPGEEVIERDEKHYHLSCVDSLIAQHILKRNQERGRT